MTRCERCGADNVFEMDLTVSDEPARFIYCRACEHRFWSKEEADRTFALSEVLAGQS